MAEHDSIPESRHVAVIGAGIVGLCTALELQRAGYLVTLYDGLLPGHGASFGNAGYIATELIEPLSSLATLRAAPRMLLDPKGPLALPAKHLINVIPWLVKFIAAAQPCRVESSRQALASLNGGAVAAWKRCLSDTGGMEHLKRSGYLLLWESERRYREAVEKQKFLASRGIHSQLVNRDDIGVLEPDLGENVSHGLLFNDAYQVSEPFLLCQHLFAVFSQRGGKFVNRRVTSLGESNGRAEILSDAGKLLFDYAVVAAGAWSRELLQSTGIDVPLEAERGYHLTLSAEDVQLNRPIGSVERKCVLSPLSSGIRIVGITELGGLSLEPVKHRFNALWHHMKGLLPGLSGKRGTCQEWMGHRPTLPDSLPVIDRHPLYPRILLAFGNQHLGLTQAAVTAEVLTGLLTGNQPQIDPAPFTVMRFK